MILKSFCVDSGPSKLFSGAGEMVHPGRTLVQPWGSELGSQNPCNESGVSPTPKTLAPKRVKTGGPLGLADFRLAWENSTCRFRATPPWWNRRTIEGYSTPSSGPQLHEQAHTQRHIGMHTLTHTDTCIHTKQMHKQIFKSYYSITIDYQGIMTFTPREYKFLMLPKVERVK